MYTLYIIPGSCSLAAHVALLESNAEFKLDNVAGATRPDHFLKINPRGSVPVLQDDSFTLREGAAILQYILDKHQNPLLPKSGQARATVLEWLSFANATLHPAYGRISFLTKNLGDAAGSHPLYTAAIANFQKLCDDLETQLQDKPYLCGDTCSIADILVTVIANWTTSFKQPVNFGPKTKELFKKVIARPAFQTALATENVTYKAAA